MNTNVEELAQRIARRVAIDPSQGANENETRQKVTPDIWLTLIVQIIQLIIQNVDQCQARPSTFRAIRRPGLFAQAVNRARARRIFNSGERSIAKLGPDVALALEAEAHSMEDREMQAVMDEIHTPDPHMVV